MLNKKEASNILLPFSMRVYNAFPLSFSINTNKLPRLSLKIQKTF